MTIKAVDWRGARRSCETSKEKNNLSRPWNLFSSLASNNDIFTSRVRHSESKRSSSSEESFAHSLNCRKLGQKTIKSWKLFVKYRCHFLEFRIGTYWVFSHKWMPISGVLGFFRGWENAGMAKRSAAISNTYHFRKLRRRLDFDFSAFLGRSHGPKSDFFACFAL